ncbi:MAG: hypothetical protein DRQ51_04780, partial [Gammaproteobacteria bacterium]
RASNVSIVDNIIHDIYGNISDGGDGIIGITPPPSKYDKHPSYGTGIFDYPKYSNNKIIGNTIVGANFVGVMAYSPKNYTIKNNTIYGNKIGIHYKKAKSNSSATITNNKIFITSGPKKQIDDPNNYIAVKLNKIKGKLKIDNNTYVSPYLDSYFSARGKGTFDVAGLKANKNVSFENSGKHIKYSRPLYVGEKVVSNLINENFDNCDKLSFGSKKECDKSKSKIKSNSLKLSFDVKNVKNGFGSKKVFKFKKGSIYKFEFDAIATKPIMFNTRISSHKGGFKRGTAYKSINIGTKKTHKTIYLKPVIDITSNFSFEINKNHKTKINSVWFDNIKLSEIKGTKANVSAVVKTSSELSKANADSILIINPSKKSKSFKVPSKYKLLETNSRKVTIKPYKSAILIKK